jgi:hypothetical protein
MLSRRAFVGKLAVGAAAAGAVTTIGSRAQARAVAEPAASPPQRPGTEAETHGVSAEVPPLAPASAPWELLAPLSAGASLGHGWQVAELSPVHAGSCVLTLAHDSGRTHRVHLCRNAGTPVGLVHTAAVDLLVMNGGAGELATDESLAQAVATVAHAVARNESAPRVAQVGLLAHAERVERFGTSAQLR